MEPWSLRGSLLFPVFLAVATVVALIAFVLDPVSRLEIPTRRGQVEQVRAKILAEAGVRRAVKALAELSLRDDVADLRAEWSYKRFIDHNGNGRYDGEGDAGEPLAFDGAGPQYEACVPLDTCLYPSFREGETIVEGRTIGYSGSLQGAAPGSRDTFSLKVLDCASMIWVNGPVDEDGKLAPWLVRVLDTLGRLRGVSSDLGKRIRAARPAGGFASRAQLRAALGEDFARVGDLITVFAWADPRAIRPACARRQDFALPAPVTRLAWPWTMGDPLNDAGALFGPVAEGPEPPRAHSPQAGLGSPIESRAPVDVNTADRDVLVALFAGLATSTAGEGRVQITDERAVSLADDILRARGERPFRSWDDFRRFLDARPYLSRAEKALVHANANPNAGLSRLNPCAARRGPFGLFGKDDLDEVGRSTELCFGSMGLYDIESIGRVVRDGRLVAQRRIHAVVRVHERYRLATQYDFETRARSRQGLLTLPEHLGDFPEAVSAVSTSASGKFAPSMFDGWIEIAPRTLSTERCSLAVLFTWGLNAEAAQGDPAARGTANHGVSVLDASDPSDLVADGFLARDAYLRYATMGSFPAAGTIEMWVKPDWDAEAVPSGPAGTRTFLSVGDARGWGPGRPASPRMVVFFRDGQVNLFYGDTAGDAWGHDTVYDEAFPAASGAGHFGKVGVVVDWRAGEWHHLCVVWEAERAWLLVDGVPAPAGPLVAHEAPFRAGLGHRTSVFLGTNRFGHHRSNGWELPALATIDDLRVYATPRLSGREREGFPPPSRFPRAGGEIVLSLLPEGAPPGPRGVLGTASWTWSAPRGVPPPEVSVEVEGRAAVKMTGEGAPQPIPGLGVVAASDVRVRVRLYPGPAPRRDSCALDDLTVTLVPREPRYLSWWEE